MSTVRAMAGKPSYRLSVTDMRGGARELGAVYFDLGTAVRVAHILMCPLMPAVPAEVRVFDGGTGEVLDRVRTGNHYDRGHTTCPVCGPGPLTAPTPAPTRAPARAARDDEIPGLVLELIELIRAHVNDPPKRYYGAPTAPPEGWRPSNQTAAPRSPSAEADEVC